MESLENTKKNIQMLGLEKIKKYFELNNSDILRLKGEQIKALCNMAKIGMQFEREMNLNKRATEMNFVRIGKLISENRTELRQYIKKSLPQYS